MANVEWRMLNSEFAIQHSPFAIPSTFTFALHPSSLYDLSVDAPIYLDHHATTPCDRRVVEAMLPYFSGDFGNPASTHYYGRRASNAIEDARVTIARFLGIRPAQLLLTAGATEANHTALGSIKPGQHA